MYATCLLLSILVVAVAFPPAAVAQNSTPRLSAEAVLLLDPEGRALYAKNAGVERPPASLVKLMPLQVLLEGVAIASANDAAAALAERLAGDETTFVANPHGLPDPCSTRPRATPPG